MKRTFSRYLDAAKYAAERGLPLERIVRLDHWTWSVGGRK